MSERDPVYIDYHIPDGEGRSGTAAFLTCKKCHQTENWDDPHFQYQCLIGNSNVGIAFCKCGATTFFSLGEDGREIKPLAGNVTIFTL